MYLPLAALLALGVAGLYSFNPKFRLLAVLTLAAALGAQTVQRNMVYQSELSIWSDTLAQRSENARALR